MGKPQGGNGTALGIPELEHPDNLDIFKRSHETLRKALHRPEAK